MLDYFVSYICWVDNYMGIFLQVFKPGIQAVVISSWKKYQVFEI